MGPNSKERHWYRSSLDAHLKREHLEINTQRNYALSFAASSILAANRTGRRPSAASGPARSTTTAVRRGAAPAPVATERRVPAVSGAAVGLPGEGVRPPFSLIGTKETAP